MPDATPGSASQAEKNPKRVRRFSRPHTDSSTNSPSKNGKMKAMFEA